MDHGRIRASSSQQDLYRSPSPSSLESHEGNLSIDRKKRPSSSSQEKLKENISHLKKARFPQDICLSILGFLSTNIINDWIVSYKDFLSLSYEEVTHEKVVEFFAADLLDFLKSKDTQPQAIFLIKRFLQDIAEQKRGYQAIHFVLNILEELNKRMDQRAEGILLEYALGTSNNKYLLGFVKEKVLPNDVVKALESFNEEYYNLQEIERVLETLKKDCSLNVEGILECLKKDHCVTLPNIQGFLDELQRASEGLEINTLDSLRIFEGNIQQLKKYYTIDLTETENILRDVEEDDLTNPSNAKAIFKNLKETCSKELENFKDITKELSEDDLVSFPNAKAIIKDLRENHCIRLSNFINLSVAEGFLQKLKEAYPDSYDKIFIYSLLQNYHDHWIQRSVPLLVGTGPCIIPLFPLIFEALKALPLSGLVAKAIPSILERPIRIQGDKYMTSRRFLYELSGALERKGPQDNFYSFTNLEGENYEGRWQKALYFFKEIGLVKLTHLLNHKIDSGNTEILDLIGYIPSKDFAHLFAEGAAGCLGPEFKEITQAWIQNPPTQDQPWSEAQWAKLDNVFIHLFEEKPEELAIFLAWSLKSHIFLPPFSSVLEFGHSEALWEHLRDSKNKKLSEELIIKVFETEINFCPTEEKLEYVNGTFYQRIKPIFSPKEEISFVKYFYNISKNNPDIKFEKFFNKYTDITTMLGNIAQSIFSPAHDFIKSLLMDHRNILNAQNSKEKETQIKRFEDTVAEYFPSARQRIEDQGENPEILEFIINYMRSEWKN